MSSTHPDFRSEQAFLSDAYQCLQRMGQEWRSQGDAGGDPKASAALRKLRCKVIDRLDDPHSICFGRIDLADGEQHYVGRQMITNNEGDLVVINWAAPAAQPFYEATPDEPLNLSLRRRFRTKRERLLGISDEVLGEGSDVEPTIGDILLEELGRERTAEMREIAATIQRDQYRIIKRPLESTTIVQGGPGTGKTAVGLHRAAFLLYRNRQQLAAGRVLVVGPNPLFMRYISYVLPSLGETAADQVAVEALGDIRPTAIDDPIVAAVKGDDRMVDVLWSAVVDRVRVPAEDVQFSASGIPFTVTRETIRDLVDGFDARRSIRCSA